MASTDYMSNEEFSNNLNKSSELDEFLTDINDLDEILGVNNNEYANSDDSEDCRDIQENHRERLLPFYAKRKDLFQHFDDEKVRRAFVLIDNQFSSL